MNVDTGEFRALKAEVAELAEMVRDLGKRQLYASTFYDMGYKEGGDAARRALLGPAAETSGPAKPRPLYLQVVDGDTP